MQTEVLVALVATGGVALGAVLSGATAILSAAMARKDAREQWALEAAERDRDRFHADRLAAYVEVVSASEHLLSVIARDKSGVLEALEDWPAADQRFHTAVSRAVMLASTHRLRAAAIDLAAAVGAVEESVTVSDATAAMKTRVGAAKAAFDIAAQREISPDPGPAATS